MDFNNEIKLLEILERIAISLERIAQNESANKLFVNNPKPQNVSQNDINNSNKITENFSYPQVSEQILNFLLDKKIKLKTYKIEEEIDNVLDNIALFIGNKYDKIKKVYNLIKANLVSGNSFKLDLKNATQEEITYSCQLCHSLHEIAFLSEYKYFKSPQYLLYARPNRIPTAINFLSGQWLERFVKLEIKNMINKLNSPVKFSYISNPQIILPNGNNFELDLLVNIENEIFWIEAKTGDYQNHIEKYSKMSKIMQLPDKHAFMVLPEISEQNCINLKKLFEMEVVNLQNFHSKFQEAINHFNNNEENKIST